MSDAPCPRILEIGAIPMFKTLLPQQTVFVGTGINRDRAAARPDDFILSPLRVPHVWRLAHEREFDLIVCRPPFFAPWDPRWLLRALFHRRVLRGEFPTIGAFGSQLLRRELGAPLAIVDHEDIPYIARHNFHLLDACRIYFKRELPVDHWRVFQRTGHRDVPTPRFRSSPRQTDRMLKLRPISLGLPLVHEPLLPTAPQAKTVDIFFAGEVVRSSSIRRQGIEELAALRDQGVRVDIPEQRLPPNEFYARMAKAWLVWSPEGLGWDCFRHYEAAACFSIPMMSRATIERHRPFEQGAQGFYYDTEPGGLTIAVRHALSDRDRLDTIAQAARAHVLAHHSQAALARYVIETTLAARTPVAA